MKITSATYLTSVVSEDKILTDGVEFAFSGRSNVGKSSFINSLTNVKKLAKTSQTPGRTRMINYFTINNSFKFVDLPGYGYAKAGKENKLMWATLMESYLNDATNLKRVFMLVDLRHPPTDLDFRMLKYLTYTGRRFTIIATKADKIAKSKIAAYVAVIAKKLFVMPNNIIPYSSETGYNKDKILQVIEDDLNEQEEIEEFVEECDENVEELNETISVDED